MKDNVEKTKKFLEDPEIAIFEEVQDVGENTQEIIKFLTKVSSSLEELKKKYKPRIGPAGPPGESIKGDPGETPQKGLHYFTAEEHEEFLNNLIDTFKELLIPAKEQLESLKGDGRLDAKYIKGLEGLESLLKRNIVQHQQPNKGGIWQGSMNQFAVISGVNAFKDIRSITFIGSTVVNKNGDITVTNGAAAATWSEEYPSSGIVDGANKVFVFDHTPSLVSLEGQTLSILNGDYTVLGNTVTLFYAPTLNPPVNKYLS